MAKSKLFADWTWRQEMPKEFADPSVQLKRSDVFSKYNSTSSKQSSMHAPTLRALLAYAALVNAVEKIEKAKNAQLAREIEIALPRKSQGGRAFLLSASM